MNRQNAALLGGVLVALLVVLAGVSLAKGGFYIGKHEGDTLHLMQIVLREARGDWPHLDFHTPIGVLATMPIALFVRLGFGIGHAILLSQALVALIFLPAIWWVSVSRFRGGAGYLFGGLTLVLILALVPGEAERSVSISMHYNRWAWAAAWLAIATAVLPPLGERRGTADGLVIGLALAAMALIKITFFVGFIVPVAVALIGRGAWRAIFVALLAGLVVAGAVTLAAGTPLFWLAYLHDLAVVAQSDVRPNPGRPFAAVVGAPAYMGGSLLLLLSVIFLRQAGRSLEGLVLLLLVPGFFYVTYQNFGNDPKWLALLGLMLLMLRPARVMHNGLGWEMRRTLGIAATAALAFAAPSAINLAYSPFRHAVVDPSKYTPLLPGSGRNEDLETASVRALRFDAKLAMDLPGTPFARYTDPELREDVTEWNGESWPACTVELGMVTWLEAMADDLKASGLTEGRTAFTADILSSTWLYGAFEPLPGASPWYYGGLPGFDKADFLLVPRCAMSPEVRKEILEAVDKTGVKLTEVRRNEMYVLYAK